MKSEKLLESFTAHCKSYPEERFWQALRNWSGHNFILASESPAKHAREQDTFYWEGKTKNEG